MKGLRIGKRRGREAEVALSPLELALQPALVDARWLVPERFNFTRDVVEALARDPKRRALMFLGSDGIIEPRTFREIAEGATVWALALRERSVAPGDRVILMAGTTVDWLEAVLGIWKVGAVVVPCLPTTSPSQLERLVSSTDAVLVVAERALEPAIERMGFTPDVHLYDDHVKRNSKEIPTDVPTHNTASRDLAFVVSTSGAGGTRKEVAHTHGSVFSTRVPAEHWLDAGRGDTVWCTATTASPLTMWNTVIGPWSRGAEVALQQGPFDLDERLDLLFRLGPSILCQTPAEYRKLAEHGKLERFRSPRLRRLVSTGDALDPEVAAVFEERWGLSIADGYGQTETNIVIANLAGGPVSPGSLGRALPGHHVSVIDDQGNELPHGVEGDLALRGRPPTLFAGYWELPEETKSAFLGDWYLTGDVAHMDEEGTFTFVGRAEDVITSSGRTFGPYDVERVLDGHPAIAQTAVVGIRDLQRGGQFVRAFVVPHHPDGGSEQLEAELREYAAQTLSGQQVPREIVFVDELPAVDWKISRHELRERPLAVRALWSTPTTVEEEERAAPPLDPEFSPRIEAQPGPEAQSALVASPTAPPPPAPEPEVLQPEPAAVQPEPVQTTPVAPEPVVSAPEPPAAATPPAMPAAPAHVDPEPTPEPVVAEAAPSVEPEPAPEPGPAPEPEAEVATELHVEAVEPETLVTHTLREPGDDPTQEQASAEPVHRPEPIAEAEVAPETPEPQAPPEPEARPEPEPATPVVANELETAAEPTQSVAAAPAPARAALEPEELPDYVVDAPDEVPPVVVPEPEPEPDLSGPLPEFVVEPDATEQAAVVHIEPAAPADEEEEDLGPLPDYVIDPNDLEAVKRHAPPPPPEPPPSFVPRPVEPEEPPATPALSFPSAVAFTLPRASRDDLETREPPSPRVRPPVEQHGNAKRSANPAEPGDEGNEVSWMEGLSNRLSAYSLSEEDERAAEEDERAAGDGS